jgi:serine/threonine protein kinase
MERLIGVNLGNLMKEITLSEATVRTIMIQILNALVYLCQKNIIHRDLKPGKTYL